ncbi:MAG: hypothetical protein ACE5SW_08595 [Nitrososphaeraceae archaeon]
MVALIVTILIDTSVVKINDLIDKYLIPMQTKLILFSINSVLCLLFQFLIIKYLQSSIKRDPLNKTFKVQAFYQIALISLGILTTLIGILIYQQFQYNYYETSISVLIITISYGTAAGFMIWLSFLFLSWYKSKHNLIVILYFISMLMIALNLITTGIYAGIKVSERPELAGEYVGGSGDVSFGKHIFLGNVYKIFSFISFFSIWITTAVLIINYREKQRNALVYWIILSIPFVYFLITYFYQYILGNIMISYLEIDPITVSIILLAFLASSKPIGGLVFGIAFWKISRIMSYERNITTYMIISGFGIFLIFAANQAIVQIISPYPSFGLSSITVLNTATFLILLGIYNSARYVSANNKLRKFIHNQALESRLLDLIGKAEMEKEIQNTVKKINQNKHILEKYKGEFEFDEKELGKYINSVIKEIKRIHE